MDEEIVRYHRIDGVIGSNEDDIDFLMAFIEWLEDRNSEFGGVVREVDEDGHSMTPVAALALASEEERG